MKRYKVQTNYNLNCSATMVESDRGEWVSYSDYLKEKKEWSVEKKRILDSRCNYFIRQGEKVDT